MLKLKLQYFGHLILRTDPLVKTLMLGKIERWEEKVVTEDEMVGWHHQLNGCEFFIFLFYNTVLVLPYIVMNLPQVYMSSQS